RGRSRGRRARPRIRSFGRGQRGRPRPRFRELAARGLPRSPWARHVASAGRRRPRHTRRQIGAGQRNAGRREAAPLRTRSKPVKVLVVDDHALLRRGMGHVIRECFSDAEVVEAGSATEALEKLAGGTIDIALVDVRMPDSDGLELLHNVKSHWPDLPVIMLTSFDHAHYVRRALAEGAAGYMLKDATPEDLEQAIKVALSGGGNVLSPKVIQNLFDAMDGTGSENGESTHRPT